MKPYKYIVIATVNLDFDDVKKPNQKVYKSPLIHRIMEYETVRYESKKEDFRKYETVKGKKLEMSLKALDNLEFEMPAVCH